jgi:hypothetical protein
MMNMARMRGVVIGCLWALAGYPQTQPPQLHYLGEVGHLEPPFSSRRSVTFGRIQVISEADGALRIQGRDDARKFWKATVPVGGGVGFTDVWQADFDRNGRKDLLVAAYFPKNGRCVDGITLSFLLFNNHGEPVPWVIDTHMPAHIGEPDIPALFTDGLTKLVVTDCSYSNPPRSGEDREITGIYEAKDATWHLIRPANLADYVALVRRNYKFHPSFDELIAPDPGSWQDRGNVLDPHGPPPVHLEAVIAASPECRGVRLTVVDGRVQRIPHDPCDELGKDRMRLSNGTVCYGWPTVVVDRSDGREIVAEPKRLNTALQEIMRERRTVILAGQSEPDRCSPTLLWAIQ